jgi:hypothetical protein
MWTLGDGHAAVTIWRQPDANALIVAALVVDLENLHGPDEPGGGEVGAAARLPVQSDDLDDAH